MRGRRISIHAPRAGSDVSPLWSCRHHPLFQSTLPVRGATYKICPRRSRGYYFNPRSPCGERRGNAKYAGSDLDISIHAPRAGSDQKGLPEQLRRRNFNPRSPCGERRTNANNQVSAWSISIHAPRAGSDAYSTDGRYKVKISIHAPRAGSDGIAIERSETKKEFQSTLPVRGATYTGLCCKARERDFNPRSPCGERLGGVLALFADAVFQSTLPVRGATMTTP